MELQPIFCLVVLIVLAGLVPTLRPRRPRRVIVLDDLDDQEYRSTSFPLLLFIFLLIVAFFLFFDLGSGLSLAR